MPIKKIRLDQTLVERGLAENIKIATSIIMQGLVHNNKKLLTKPGLLVDITEEIKVKNIKKHSFVSRGGIKLAKALSQLNILVLNKICMDIGCSTGGFTQVLLQNGAGHVFAIDVGYGEFDYQLRIDKRVTLIERTNCRYLTNDHINQVPNLIVCDVSFISLKLALVNVLSMISSGVELLLLIKPQFEGPKGSAVNGIVNDPSVWDFVCNDITQWLEKEHNCNVKNIIASSILGAKGNKEFFVYAIKN